RKSLDARVKDDLCFVYSAEVLGCADEARLIALARHSASAPVRIEGHEEAVFRMPPPGSLPMHHRPIVVGSGPAGLVAGYFLAEQGYRPIVLERGRPVRA